MSEHKPADEKFRWLLMWARKTCYENNWDQTPETLLRLLDIRLKMRLNKEE